MNERAVEMNAMPHGLVDRGACFERLLMLAEVVNDPNTKETRQVQFKRKYPSTVLCQ